MSITASDDRVMDLENALYNLRVENEKEQKCRRKIQRENQTLKLHVDRSAIDNTRAETDIFERLQTTISRFDTGNSRRIYTDRSNASVSKV